MGEAHHDNARSDAWLQRSVNAYARAYRGLDPRTWRLTIGVLIQRAGTMVLPFLTIYLAKEANMSEPQVASIVLYHGLGAIVGSLLATQTMARFSTRTNMLVSLVTTAVALLALYFAQSYLAISLCAGLFMLCEAPFRPAVMTQIARIEPKDKQAQAIALLRVGVNAGMMLGPSLGGILAIYDFAYLFYVDAITCILAAIWLMIYVSPESSETHRAPKSSALKSAARVLADKTFLLLWLAQLCQFLVIFQLVSTLPLFLNQARGFDEAQVGRYFLINGLMILALEMGLVRWVRRFKPAFVFGVGACIMAWGVAAVELVHTPWLIYLSVVLWTGGEMVSMPLINSIVVSRSQEHSSAYLTWFSTATNVAMVVAGPVGLWIAHRHGYTLLWGVTAMLGLCCLVLGFAIHWSLRPSP